MDDSAPDFVRHIAKQVYQKRVQYNTTPRGRTVSGLRSAAADCGVSAATLSRIERGHIPDLKTFRKICVWLGVTSDSLLLLQGQENDSN